MMGKEKLRMKDPDWKKWGPYVSNRQWGTVREDYSANGDAWNFTSHDMARSKAWRWGEEGIAGICDDQQLLCFGLSLWNKRDSILKERFFGLTNTQGNHGEDVKELYYYLDNTPSHSYMKMLYKYPQSEFPYSQLITVNQSRSRKEPEYELIDTGIFDDNQYFDVYVEYAKLEQEDILIQIKVCNRSDKAASLHVIPTMWFRNTWSWGRHDDKPSLWQSNEETIQIKHKHLNTGFLYFDQGEPLFCENESNNRRLYNIQNSTPYPKDGINDYIIHSRPTINPAKEGTKVGINVEATIGSGEEHVFRLRLTGVKTDQPFEPFDKVFLERAKEAKEFYDELQKSIVDPEERMIQRQAFAGMLWNKQFYHYDVQEWLDGDPAFAPPPELRHGGRNADWRHLNNADILSVPDKWEFPWYATWDLAFHTITLAKIDPDFAKQQLILITKEWYMNPSGAFPAYEWAFGEANPPVHAMAAYEVFLYDGKTSGKKDYAFLEIVFHKLLINFTWWVNRKDTRENNIFEGGFLGLDNISPFDRNAPLPGGAVMEQADATSWMAMYALNMLHIALELSEYNESYTEMTTKFFEHFLYIAGAMSSMGEGNKGLWDEEDEFFYDQVRMSDDKVIEIKVKSMVGLIPLFAVEVITKELLDRHPVFAVRMEWFLNHRPDLAALVSRWYEGSKEEMRLLSLLRGHRMKCLLRRALDETEFLSKYGVRSLSKRYENNPYFVHGESPEDAIHYLPGESDNGMFGGNSNWRGPIWFPVNYLIITSLRKFHFFYAGDFKIEYPTTSGQFYTLYEVSNFLIERLIQIFKRDSEGKRPVFGDNAKLQTDVYFKDYLLFHEYFHGDNGKGLGASHQTGWTGLVADLISLKYEL
jgi:hypothetical protein